MAKTIAELTAIAHRHAAAEAEGDLAATLATLEPEPVYELYPVGLRMTGLPLARRYYEHFFAHVAPRIAGYEMLGEWINEQGVLQEYRVSVRYDDGRCATSASWACSSSATPRSRASACTPTRSSCASSSSRSGSELEPALEGLRSLQASAQLRILAVYRRSGAYLPSLEGLIPSHPSAALKRSGARCP